MLIRITTQQLSQKPPTSPHTLIDITVKSGEKMFAPTWGMVMGYKNGILSEEGYTCQYRKMMQDSYITNQSAWKTLVQQAVEKDRLIVLACYCKAGDFCHRHLLKGYLARVAEHMGYGVEVLEETK